MVKMKNSVTIQYMRAIAILMVVFQHVIVAVNATEQSQKIAAVLYSVDVYVFFVISGYLFQLNKPKYQEKGFLRFMADKGKSLLVPYLVWGGGLFGVVYFLYFLNNPRISVALMAIGFERMSVLGILKALFTYNTFYVQLYWFIYVLFLIMTASFFMPDKVGAISATVIVLGLVLTYLVLSTDSYLLKKITACFPVFSIGRIYRLVEEKYPLKNSRIFLRIGVGMVLFCFLQLLPYSMFQIRYLNRLYIFILEVLRGTIGTIVVYYSSYFLTTKNLKILLLIGNKSFAVYIMHNPYVVKLSAMVLNRTFLPKSVCVLVVLIAGITIPILVERFIVSRSSILRGFLLGQWKTSTKEIQKRGAI